MTTATRCPLISEAELITKLAEYQRQLRQVIHAGKLVVKSLPERERMILLEALIEAEGKLK